jgi:hypothetical protein
MHHCEVCDKHFQSKRNLDKHLAGERHNAHVLAQTRGHTHTCFCGRGFLHASSMYRHRRTCTDPPCENNNNVSDVNVQIQEMREALDEERKIHQQERDELRAQISLLLDRQATVNNTNTTNSNNNTSIENQNNTINININAFGQENMDYIDEGVVTSCLDRVFKSIPTLLQHIHFDPAHPENHNIKITNKKLPYASVMGENKKWKTVNKKDAIETMVTNGYNILDEKYGDYKDALSSRRQQHFENFQSRYEDEDKDLMKQLKNEVELMVINGPPEA